MSDTNTRKLVIITADGACLGNGRENTRAAAAAILEYSGRRRAVACYIGASTNQRAEMIAAAFALESLKEPCQVILRTDSQYVVETMNGTFKRKSNLELWDRLDKAAAQHEVSYQWIRGHNGNPEQEAADKIARSTAKVGEPNPLVLSEAVARLENNYTPALREAVTSGLRYLASHCDGARDRDGIGFSKFDADFGHTLASKAFLSPRDVASGRRLLLRYQRQLNAFNPSLAAIL
jgi:ribonuclease HI